uniref:Discoidin, CUB and LCCL domain containing 2 n=1 Tax=Pavo cristatus TaxID=9049 RepID=A0A8C9FUF4_PAVCR
MMFRLSDGCGHTVLGPESGTLASINYPQTSPNSTVCEWEIRVKPGQRIQLKFGDLDIDDSDSCHSSYLRVHNGIGPTRTEIGKYCGFGFQMDGLITSRGNEVTVQFMSGVHTSGRGFLAAYSTTDKSGICKILTIVLKYCPAGCVIPFADISGTIPHGYRDSSSLCMAGVHAGVVSNTLGGQINVVISKGIPYYEGSLANNVTSKVPHLFLCSGCYGTLGMESGVISDSQITASSILEWPDQTGRVNTWKPENARLKRHGPPWAALDSDERQWLQIDLNKEKRITGKLIGFAGGRNWMILKVFQGNTELYQEVRNNFIPPIIARFVRINPLKWHQKIAMKVELLGCQFSIGKATDNFPILCVNRVIEKCLRRHQLLDFIHSVKTSLQTDKTTFTPEIKNTTVTPKICLQMQYYKNVAAVLCGTSVCALPTGWWKGMKQFLPTKSAEHEETPVRYSSSEIGRLRPREVPTMLQTESAEYAQPLVGGIVGTLHQRSTFKPEEGKEASYADLDPYNSPIQEVYHAYAEPLPITGPEYATPIVMDMSSHPSTPLGVPSISTFKAAGNQAPSLVGTYNKLLSRTDSAASAQALYDTPKGQLGPGTAEELVYQVPQSTAHSISIAQRGGGCPVPGDI